MENRTADIIQETKKLQIRKKDSSSIPQNNASMSGTHQQPLLRAHMQPQTQADLETQLKASRDVRWQLCNTGLAMTYHIVFIYHNTLFIMEFY